MICWVIAEQDGQLEELKQRQSDHKSAVLFRLWQYALYKRNVLIHHHAQFIGYWSSLSTDSDKFNFNDPCGEIGEPKGNG